MTQRSLSDLIGLIRADALRPPKAGPRKPLNASESDKGRVVNSAAFRRLQQKAQVFPLDPNASVRTRLTHSIEVSQLGRYLAQKVIQKAGSATSGYEELAAIVNTVETACLLHDIGNPPFGHLGEAAIREWFTTNKSTVEDLKWFDGNPQGFRLISLLSGKDEFGLNLTCSLLLSTIKYPWSLKHKLGAKKIGIFDMDLGAYEAACNALGWTAGHHFPFALLMEAADDIAYSMSDLEDGIEKKIIRISDLTEVFGADRFESDTVHPIIAFKTSVINEAIETAAEAFANQLDQIMSGESVQLISENSSIGKLLEKVKGFAREKLYSAPAAELVELAGRSVIRGLLDHLGALLELSESTFTGLIRNDKQYVRGHEFQLRLLRRLPTGYVEKYLIESRGPEEERRAHLIVDFIGGMTDDFALDTFQILQGIKIQ